MIRNPEFELSDTIYKPFYHKTHNGAIRELIDEGFLPINSECLLKAIKDIKDHPTYVENIKLIKGFDLNKLLLHKINDTSDRIFYHGKSDGSGIVSIVKHPLTVKSYSGKELENYSLPITTPEDYYQKRRDLEIATFNIKHLIYLLNRPLSKADAKDNPIGAVLAGDVNLWREIVDYAFYILNRDYGTDYGMGTYLNLEWRHSMVKPLRFSLIEDGINITGHRNLESSAKILGIKKEAMNGHNLNGHKFLKDEASQLDLEKLLEPSWARN